MPLPLLPHCKTLRAGLSNIAFIVIILLSFLFARCFPVYAQTEEPPYKLDPIIVTEEKQDDTFQTGDVNLVETPSFYSLITHEEFEHKIEGLPDILRKQPGVQVRQSGGLGSFSTVSLRGSNSDQVMIYMDGILLNEGATGGFNLSSISLDSVDSVEVYRGTTPVNFGKASLGGVVNIRTLRSKGDISGSVTGGYGSFNTQKYSGVINHKPGKWDYLVSSGSLKSDNNFGFKNIYVSPGSPSYGRTERRRNAQFRQKNLLTKAGYDFSDHLRLDLLNDWFKNHQHIPGRENYPLTDTFLDAERNNTAAKLTADNVGRFKLNLSTQLYYSWNEEEFDDSDKRYAWEEVHMRKITRKYGTHFFGAWPVGNNVLSAGCELYRETYDSRDLLETRRHDPLNYPGTERDYLSMALQDDILLHNDRLSITPMLRFFYYRDEQESFTNEYGYREEGEDSDDAYLRPQFGVRYWALDWLTLKANFAQYVREPSFYELYGDPGFLEGNPDLKSEKGSNIDIGFDVMWKSDHPFIQDIFGSAAFFVNRVDDLISPLYDPTGGLGELVNISEATIVGVESSCTIDALSYFRCIGNLTWQDTENKDRDFSGNQLPGRYEWMLFGRIEATYNGATVYGEYISERDMYYDLANMQKARNKNEINVGASWRLRSFIISLEGRNVTDKQYADDRRSPQPGKAWYGTIRYEFS